jgi:hypothetical protein
VAGPVARLLVLLVDLKLQVVGVKQIPGKAGHMLQVVLAGLGDPKIRLTIGDIADDAADDEDRNDHQRQHHHQHLPTQLEIIYGTDDESVHGHPGPALPDRARPAKYGVNKLWFIAY